MLGQTRRVRSGLDIWPGFVDVLATLLLVFVFMLSVFLVAQYYLSDVLSGRNRAIAQLQQEVGRLADALSLERGQREELAQRLELLQEELRASLKRREELRGELAQTERTLAESAEELEMRLQERGELQQRLEGVRERLAEEEEQVAQLQDRNEELRTGLMAREQELEEVRSEADAEVTRLNRQVAALREQLQQVAAALEASEQTVEEQQARIEDLGQRLNVALARRVEELNRYRSEFFGRLREALGDHPDIRVVGDRFMLQSELLFATGSAELGPEGRDKLRDIAETLKAIAPQIPEGVDWVLQVEGHTDRRPISTLDYPSNWELSTARATSIVHYLIEQGIPADRLAAAGFAQFQPVAEGNTPEAMARNRRIELKLTSR